MSTHMSRYPSDLSDKEWALIADLVKPDPSGGRPSKYPCREILNAIFYVAKTGCQWRYLPKNLPPWKAVYMQFLRWRDNGKIEHIYDVLHRKLRGVLGKMKPQVLGSWIANRSKQQKKGARRV